MVDVLAKRYGWSFKQISEEMYWEDVYRYYEMACNLNTLERNDEMHFQFLLHAQTKEAANSWQEQEIPYPDRDWKPVKPTKGVDPNSVFSRSLNRVKGTEEDKKRFQEVRRRLEEARLEEEAALRAYYGG